MCDLINKNFGHPAGRKCKMGRSLLISFSLLLFALSAGLAQTTSTPAPYDGSGIEGTISISPAQGGPTRAGQSNSGPLSNTAFEIKQDGRSIGEFQTDEQGHFRVFLSSGRYTVSRKDQQAIGSFGPFEVTVVAGKMSSVRWECDSGLR
jgi:hypothetical protein